MKDRQDYVQQAVEIVAKEVDVNAKNVLLRYQELGTPFHLGFRLATGLLVRETARRLELEAALLLIEHLGPCPLCHFKPHKDDCQVGKALEGK